MESKKQYADRDHRAQGGHYINHVGAMTAEGLHRKSAIAAEPAHRDIEIARLHAENTALQSGYDAARLEIASLQTEIAKYRKALKPSTYAGCVVWAGDYRVVRRVTELEILHCRDMESALNQAAGACIHRLANPWKKQTGGTP